MLRGKVVLFWAGIVLTGLFFTLAFRGVHSSTHAIDGGWFEIGMTEVFWAGQETPKEVEFRALVRSANSDCFCGDTCPTDVPISTELTEEYAPQIARYDGQVYVAWHSDNNVFLAVSTDGGWTWGQPVTLTGRHPAIAVDANGNLHVSYWHSDIVYYIQSTDGGQTFTPPLSLGAGHSPDITADANGNPYVVWEGQWSGPDEFTDVILARFTVQGYSSVSLTTTITTTIVATTTRGYSEPPKVAVSPSGQNVYVIWKCPPHYPAYVRTYFARSIDGGDTFEPRCNPTGFTHHGEYSPDVAAFGEDTVYITWVLDQYGDRRINFARSENSGECESFSPRLELGQSGRDYDSTIAADALGQVCVAWRQDTEQDKDLYFRCSLDGGQNFLPAHLLVSGPSGTLQYKPALALWNNSCATCLDAVWEDARNDNRDIFFSSIPVLTTWYYLYLPIILK